MISFLAPAFAAAGLALAALPIAIHLLNRRRYRTVEWAAMDFLLRAMRKNRRRVRFEQWLLLATRCLVLALLGLALSRPLGCDNSSHASFGGRTGLHVFVVDNSYSMSYLSSRQGANTHLEQAKIIAGQMIDKLSAGGESVVIITAGKPATGVLPKPSYDLQQARAILGRVPQSFGATDLAAALRTAIDVGRENERQTNKNLYILSDATASAWQGPDAAAIKAEGQDLAKLYRVVSFNLSKGAQWNQAVLNLYPSSNLVTTNTQFGADFIADVKAYGVPHDATLQWKVDGKLIGGGGAMRPDTGTQTQTEPQSQLQSSIKAGGAHLITASVVGDDPLQVDNSRNRVINVLSQLKALIVEGQHGAGQEGGSGLNLQVALAGLSKAGQSDGFAAPDLISDLELADHLLADYRAVILCGVSQLTPAEADELQSFVKSGGTLMVFLGENISADNYNTVMLPRHLIPGPLTKRMIAGEGNSYYFDFNANGVLHPLMKAFEHQENTGLENAQAFGYWQTDVPNDPQLRVLNWKPSEGVHPDPGTRPDPAITQETVGTGRVVFVSTSANEEWVTFTRKPVYTELVNELLSGSVNVGDAWMNLVVGDELRVPSTLKLTSAPALLDPKSRPVALQLTTASDGTASYVSTQLAEPGAYTLATGTTRIPIAVNVPAEEADVHTIDNTAIKTALGGIDLALNDDQIPTETAMSSAGSDWGWGVMLAVLCVVGLESFLAMQFGHFRR